MCKLGRFELNWTILRAFSFLVAVRRWELVAVASQIVVCDVVGLSSVIVNIIVVAVIAEVHVAMASAADHWSVMTTFLLLHLLVVHILLFIIAEIVKIGSLMLLSCLAAVFSLTASLVSLSMLALFLAVGSLFFFLPAFFLALS